MTRRSALIENSIAVAVSTLLLRSDLNASVGLLQEPYYIWEWPASAFFQTPSSRLVTCSERDDLPLLNKCVMDYLHSEQSDLWNR